MDAHTAGVGRLTQATNPQRPCPAAAFFSEAVRSVLSLSFSLRLTGHRETKRGSAGISREGAFDQDIPYHARPQNGIRPPLKADPDGFQIELIFSVALDGKHAVKIPQEGIVKLLTMLEDLVSMGDPKGLEHHTDTHHPRNPTVPDDGDVEGWQMHELGLVAEKPVQCSRWTGGLLRSGLTVKGLAEQGLVRQGLNGHGKERGKACRKAARKPMPQGDPESHEQAGSAPDHGATADARPCSGLSFPHGSTPHPTALARP